MESSIAERLESQRARISSAARGAGRDASEIKLLAVSKTVPQARIREAYAAGQRDFGENYVQELRVKAEQLKDLTDLRWHMIGHLQTNKVKYVTGVVHAVHTVDSLRLAQELERRMASHASRWSDAEHPQLPVLVEVNVGGETQKSGVSPRELAEVLSAIEALPHLQLQGLMTIPPLDARPEASRPYFESLARLRDEQGGVPRLPELSMGMSQDAEVAISCGATWVRIGSAIFGARTQPA